MKCVAIYAALVLMCALFCGNAGAGGLREADYQAAWCGAEVGHAEYRLTDGTRCDCLTATHAVEFDFARKWAEAIGQALHYAAMTGKRPGVVLIVGQGEERYLERLRSTVEAYGLPLDVWTMAAVKE